MIKPFVLEKVDADGSSVVVARYSSCVKAIKRYNFLTKLKSVLGLKYYPNYLILVEPFCFVIYELHNTTKKVSKFDTFDNVHDAIKFCNDYNSMTDGTFIYYISCEIKED